MPPIKQALSSKLKQLAEQFSEDTLYYCENRKLICRCCGFIIGPDSKDNIKRWSVSQHVGSAKHQSSKEVFGKQRTLNYEKDTFFADICQAFVAADIPIFKLNNPTLRSCWEKYSGRQLPEQSTIRKNYVNESYQITMASIRQEIGNASIWVSIDETTDANGRFIANVIIGKLSSSEAGRPLLLNVAELEKTNHQTISSLFHSSMSLLWPNGVEYSKVLLYVTDAAPYMVKSGAALKNFYPNLLHVTCLAHGLHRIAESVRSKFKLVDKFVGSMKKIFVKAPGRVTAFKELYPNLALPPKPVLTRWGTWLNTVAYYAENLNEIQSFINSLDEDDSAAIKQVQKIFRTKKPKMTIDILQIEQYYKGIADTITKLETACLPMADAAELWTDASSLLSNSPHQVVAEKAISVSIKIQTWLK